MEISFAHVSVHGQLAPLSLDYGECGMLCQEYVMQKKTSSSRQGSDRKEEALALGSPFRIPFEGIALLPKHLTKRHL